MKQIAFLLWTSLVTSSIAFAQAQQLPELPQVQPQVTPVLIDDVLQAKIAMHPATPYLESSSLLLVDIDVEKLDLQATVDWIQTNFAPASNVPLPPGQVAMAQGIITSLKDAGAAQIYVTASTRAMFDGGAVIVIPCEDVAAVKAVAASVVQGISEQANYIVHAGEDAVLIGPQVSVDRLVAGEGAARSDLLKPIILLRGSQSGQNDNAGANAAEKADHIAILSLPDEAREELVELWPEQLPNAPELKISPRELAADIHSILIAWKLPPDPHVTVTLKTPEAAVARVESVIKRLIELSPQAQQAITTETSAGTVTIEATPEKISTLLEELSGPPRERARHMASANALKQIGLAMHNYHDAQKHFPPRIFTDPDGKPLLSWRVAILPYVDQAALADAIKMDQAWNGPDNKKLGEIVVPTYSTGNQDGENPAKTRIRVPVMKGSFWQGDGPPRSIRDIRDGTSNTIAAILAPQDAAVTWTSPEPWVISDDDPMKDVFGDNDLIITLFFDGSVRTFAKADLNNKKLTALLTYDGGETVE